MSDSHHFMIVDENDKNALFWEMAIKSEYASSDVVVHKTAFAALDAARQNKFDFFISSVELEPMSGLIFMQKIREIKKYRFTPFLIFSQSLTEQDLMLAQEFGITNTLVKPFDKARVLEKIKNMIEGEANLDPVLRSLRKIEDWLAEGKANEGLKLISQCLKDGPHAARAHTVHGDIWVKADQPEQAEQSYKKALAIDPTYIPARNGLGRLYLKLKRFNEAVENFEVIHKKCPRNLDRMNHLGNAYLETGETDKAQKMFADVKSHDGENADAAEGLGKVEFQKGNLDKAASFFKECGKGDDVASYFNNMGIAMVNQGKFAEAIKMYQNAITVLPNRSKTHMLEFNVGLACKKANRFGEAAEAFARSLLESPTYVKAYQGLVAAMQEAKSRNQPFKKELTDKAAALHQEKQNSQTNKAS